MRQEAGALVLRLGPCDPVPDAPNAPRRLRVSTRAARGTACHVFVGDLDAESVGELDLAPVAGASVVELDLRGVAYLDSAGLRRVVDLADAYVAAGALPRVTVSSPALLRAFDAVGLIDSYDVHVVRP